MTDNPYRAALTRRAKAYGIRPAGQSFLHLELGTTHLLHAVDRYLTVGASVACLVPGTVFSGHHQELFRRRRFLDVGRRVDLEITEVWQIERGTFKYPGAAIIGHRSRIASESRQTAIKGFFAGQDHLDPADFSIRNLGRERSAWVLEKGGLPVAAAGVSAVPQQGADLMPRTAVCIEVLNDEGVEFRVDTPVPGSAWAFTVKSVKELKGVRFPGYVAPEFIYRMAQSENLLPFVFGEHCAPIAIPALRDGDGVWTICGEGDIRRMGFVHSARRFRAINAKLRKVGKGASLQERINVRLKLSKQVYGGKGHLILAGAGGKHICAACIQLDGRPDLIVDQTLYWRFVEDESEAWYFVGMLGSRAMTEAILPFNPKGAFGERHIHALPYRVMAEYDPDNEDHREISVLARIVAARAADLIEVDDYLADPSKSLARRRTRLRERLWRTDDFKRLDRICSAVLGTSAVLDQSSVAVES